MGDEENKENPQPESEVKTSSKRDINKHHERYLKVLYL